MKPDKAKNILQLCDKFIVKKSVDDGYGNKNISEYQYDCSKDSIEFQEDLFTITIRYDEVKYNHEVTLMYDEISEIVVF